MVPSMLFHSLTQRMVAYGACVSSSAPADSFVAILRNQRERAVQCAAIALARNRDDPGAVDRDGFQRESIGADIGGHVRVAVPRRGRGRQCRRRSRRQPEARARARDPGRASRARRERSPRALSESAPSRPGRRATGEARLDIDARSAYRGCAYRSQAAWPVSAAATPGSSTSARVEPSERNLISSSSEAEGPARVPPIVH